MSRTRGKPEIPLYVFARIHIAEAGDPNCFILEPGGGMSLATLHDLMIHELKDLYSAERQLVAALPRMAKAASSDELRAALEKHLGETTDQVTRIEHIMDSFGESPRGQKCQGMEGLVGEGKSMLKADADPDVMDAGIIVAAQKVEHYEIATYGAVREYARMMGHTEAVRLIEQTLEEEKNADATLNKLAEGGINALAERDANGSMNGDEEDEASSSSGRRGAKPTRRSRSSRART